MARLKTKPTRLASTTSTSSAQRGTQNIQDSLGQGLYDTLSGNFDDIGRNFGNMIKRMAAEATATQLSRSLFGDLVQGGPNSGLFSTAFKGIGAALGLGGQLI